ncbi:MAG: sulfatase-like hydrolase/transferase, partial [Verrucomicrobiales bacterium]|nr:sulfatase-like hydrolase/transferase [Verrucomicrobiales bacterium]
MKAKKKCIVRGLAICLILSGCSPKVAPENQAKVFRLVDLFSPEDLTGKVTLDDAGWKRVQWPAQEMAPWTPPPKTEADGPKPVAAPAPALGFRALNDLGELKTDQNKLSGDISGPAPVLHFALKENRGGAETVKFIEVRMNVSGAKHVWLRPEANASVDDSAVVKWASQSEPWNTSVEVAENKVHTYRFEIRSDRDRRGGPGGRGGGPGPGGPGGPGGAGPGGPGARGGPGGGPPPGPGPSSGDLRHFFITFRECQSPKFSIESIRFMSEREEKLKEESGQQWAGLAEIYRETLAAKTPEIIRIPLRELPARPWLDLAIGTKEDAPVTFKVSLANRDESNESAPAILLERTITIPNRWQTTRIDLAAYAGKSVVVELALAGEKKGLWGYWGSPVVRSQLAVVQSATASGASQTKRKPRGVIFLVIDTLRKDHLNIYGYERPTLVYLKKFAEEGVAFSHAISQATMTKISIPSMVTSLYPLSHTVLGFEKGLPASAKTIAEVFREEGYATVAYSSVPFTGKSNNMHQGYDELHEVASISDNEYRSKTARHYVDRLIPWIEQHRDVPFFAFLHVFDPHSPFRPRPPYDTIWGATGNRERLTELEADMRKHNVRTGLDNLPEKEGYVKTGNDPDELLKIYTDWYDGSIRGVDAEIGRLLQALKEMGLDQDTLMVFSADHGEELWEHGKFFHGHSVYGELNQVPLVFRWPNSPEIRKGAMIDHQVENIDIMPTLLDLAGIKGPTNMQGRTLVTLLNGSGAATWKEQPAFTQAMVGGGPPGGGGATNNQPKPHFGIVDQRWKLVRKEVDPEVQQELYEHPVDSLNLTNIIKSDEPASHVGALTETLVAWKSRARAAQLASDETMTQQLSSEELRRLRALGYVGGAPARPATNNAANATTNDTTNTTTTTNTNTRAGAG